MQVKICGITNLKDALLAIDAGAHALGFNFYTKSPRFILPEVAKNIIRRLPGDILTVGVFVNADRNEVLAIHQKTGIQSAQLHGDEDGMNYQPFHFPIIKTLRLHSAEDVCRIQTYRHFPAYLIDADDKYQYGGTGKNANWDLAYQVARRYPTWLAGGLHAGNVRAAISVVRPLGIDVCSGVEHEPGKKSKEKLIALFSAI